MHIIVATEPRSYREILSAVLQVLRPMVTIALIGPEQLEHEVVRMKPQIVLCSHATPAIEAHSLAWIIFYPNGQRIVEIRSGQLHVTSGDLDLNGLLAFIDDTAAVSIP
jgi:hypothetical protein